MSRATNVAVKMTSVELTCDDVGRVYVTWPRREALQRHDCTWTFNSRLRGPNLYFRFPQFLSATVGQRKAKSHQSAWLHGARWSKCGSQFWLTMYNRYIMIRDDDLW